MFSDSFRVVSIHCAARGLRLSVAFCTNAPYRAVVMRQHGLLVSFCNEFMISLHRHHAEI